MWKSLLQQRDAKYDVKGYGRQRGAYNRSHDLLITGVLNHYITNTSNMRSHATTLVTSVSSCAVYTLQLI